MKHVLQAPYLIALILLLGNGCGPRHGHGIQREQHELKKITYQKSGYEIEWHEKAPQEQDITHGITQDEAVRMALLSNPSLHAKFERIGISKSNLIQAGFLSNPRIDSIFQFSRKPAVKGCIELDVSMTISDLWQIPMRKKVAEDQLALTSTEILQEILSVIENTKQSYNRVVFEEAQLKTITAIVDVAKQLRDRTYQRQCAGFASDFDIYFAEVAVGEWEVKLIHQEMALSNAYLALRNAIGTDVVIKPLKTLTNLKRLPPPLSDPLELVAYAKHNKPETHINLLRIQQAQHQRSLEKRKILNDVDVGISFTREPSGNKLIGPSIGFEMPFFDWNQAQIEKTRYEEKMARHDLENTFAQTEQAVQQLYTAINSHIKTINVFTSRIIPQSTAGIEYARTYADSMQLDFITLFTTEIDFYKKELELNTHYFELWQTIAAFEKELGGSIPKR